MYYAEYSSTTTGLTGCVKRFATLPREIQWFPAQINVSCDLCKNTTHGFRLVKTYLVTTPSQERNFALHCESQGIEPGLDLWS